MILREEAQFHIYSDYPKLIKFNCGIQSSMYEINWPSYTSVGSVHESLVFLKLLTVLC